MYCLIGIPTDLPLIASCLPHNLLKLYALENSKKELVSFFLFFSEQHFFTNIQASCHAENGLALM